MKRNSMGTMGWLSILAVLLAAPVANAQADSTLYLMADCMKSTSPDYVDVELDLWKPMHQKLVDDGRKRSWALWAVRFGDMQKCDYYTVSTFYGIEAVEDDLSDLEEVFKQVHPGADFADAMDLTAESRELRETRLWRAVDAVPFDDFKYAFINGMNAPDGAAYVELERTVFKPIHEALVADGVTKGWILNELVSPRGSSMPFNYSTVDLVDSIDQIPFGRYFETVHPDKDLDEVWMQTLETRDMVSSELWYLVDRVAAK